MTIQLNTEQLEQQISQLPLHEQLRLAAHICERLSASTQTGSFPTEAESLEQHNQREADRILALCEAAAEKWEGEFDSVAEIQQLRRERDHQIWPNKS